MNFHLHPDLVRDCIEVRDLPLCKVLLRNDARFPWLILVPRRANVSELFELSEGDQRQCHKEVMQLARAMKAELKADKMNIAALGNMTPQLHIHVIARFKNDAAWPQPVRNAGRAKPYNEAEKLALMKRLLKITNL